MNRIIINNKSDAGDLEAIEMVKYVVGGGRVSKNGKQYCFLTIFSILSKFYSVASFLNKKSDMFVILNYKGE